MKWRDKIYDTYLPDLRKKREIISPFQRQILAYERNHLLEKKTEFEDNSFVTERYNSDGAFCRIYGKYDEKKRIEFFGAHHEMYCWKEATSLSSWIGFDSQKGSYFYESKDGVFIFGKKEKINRLHVSHLYACKKLVQGENLFRQDIENLLLKEPNFKSKMRLGRGIAVMKKFEELTLRENY